MSGKDMQMIADRWMMESRRLVNWGSYEGYHEFRPSTDSQLPVTLLAGASESGKSTLVDAQISLLYPTGTPFNKASNSGRSERSDYTYLRGMIGVGGSDGVDEPMYLRGRDESGAPRSIWGAIVDTYRNFTTGQILSCGKFLYLMPGDGRGDVRRLYLAWDKPIDPRRMDVFRESSFTPTQLKSTYPGCVTFPNAEAFHTHIWDVMGLSAEACRLLARIQSADAPSRLDDIFKQGVLGVPEALDLARATVEDYERYDANFRSMEEKTRRMGKLRAITASYGDYESARDAVHSFDAVNPATKSGSATIRAWAIRRMIGEVSERQPLDRRLRDERRSEARAAGKRIESLRTRIDAVRERMRGLDGGDLTRLDAEMRQAERALADITAGRQRIGRMFEAAGEEFPKDEHAWDERRIEAVTFMRSYEQRKGLLDDMRNQTYAAHASVKQTLQRLNDDYERQKSQRTRISRQMDETRAMLCRATGLGPSELPYVAELMDVREDQEHWRLAMNAAYGSMAQTILVDKRHERGFAAKVSAIDPHAMARRTWQFVDTERGGAGNGPGGANTGATGGTDGEVWLSSKLRYREDSPFAGWLREQTSSERLDALCVDGIDDSDHAVRQVQADGQIKSGKRGQHGIKDHQQVIGFVNESYLAQLRTRIQDAQRQCDETAQSYASAKEQADRLQRERELADQLAYTAWEKIDENSAKAAIADIERTIASVRNNPKLAELDTLQESLSKELDRSQRQRIDIERQAELADQAVNAAQAWLDEHAAQPQPQPQTRPLDGEAADVSPKAVTNGRTLLTDEVEEALAESYEQRLSGLGDATTRAHMIIGAGAPQRMAQGDTFADRVIAGIGKDLEARVSMLEGRAASARTAVEARMGAYIEMYAGGDDTIAASVDDYRYYQDELESLSKLATVEATAVEYHNCLDKLLMSFLTIKRAIDTDAGDIHDQLERINAMLDGQQFGPRHGSLSLHADVRRPERAFWSALTRVIGTLNDRKAAQTDDDLDGARCAFASCAAMIDMLRREIGQIRDVNGVKSYGARNLDPRCRSSFYALVRHSDGQVERITSTGGRSGGALQELTSFVYGAALIYLLGGGMDNKLKPSYTTLFLDEALIKADGRYTRRALSVLPRLGFQVIVSAPESKTGEILEVSTKAYVTRKDPDTGYTTLHEARLDGIDEMDGADAPEGTVESDDAAE